MPSIIHRTSKKTHPPSDILPSQCLQAMQSPTRKMDENKKKPPETPKQPTVTGPSQFRVFILLQSTHNYFNEPLPTWQGRVHTVFLDRPKGKKALARAKGIMAKVHDQKRKGYSWNSKSVGYLRAWKYSMVKGKKDTLGDDMRMYWIDVRGWPFEEFLHGQLDVKDVTTDDEVAGPWEMVEQKSCDGYVGYSLPVDRQRVDSVMGDEDDVNEPAAPES